VGSYTVTAAPVTTAGSIVGTVNTGAVTGSPATVAVGTTAAATATYTQRPGSGGLWIANSVTLQTVVQYSAGQLASSTSAPPAVALATGDPRPFGAAFDANGNLWVPLFNGNAVVEYTASQLASSGTPTAAVNLTANAGSLSQPAGLAFDASGNLWVSNVGANTVVQFSVSQLASSGSPTPAVTVGASSGSLNAPVGIAFDASGNLWVGNALGNTLVAFNPSQLAANGTPTPAVTLSANANSIDGVIGLAFDGNGNLWIANGNSGFDTVVQFSASQLASTGAPTPPVILTATAGSLADPAGLAFDNSGNLWVANFSGSSVVEFTSSQLVTSGSPTPNVIVSGGSLGGPFGIAFDPHAANLPLKP
jgi:streptogramin lyase